MDEQDKNAGQDEAEKHKGKEKSTKDDCPLDCDPGCGGCDCGDGPACLAALLFIALFFILTFGGYALYYVVASMLGYQPAPMRGWDKTGAIVALILTTCTIVSGYAWWWMEKHGK